MTFNLEKCIGCNTCTVACKNIWTNREGAEYMWWNNVETKPGIGYPKKWEDQDLWKGGWEKKGNKLTLRYGRKSYMLSNLFFNPHTPEMKDYYGDGDVYSFTFDDLHDTEASEQPNVARPKSMVTGEEDIPIDWGVNWEDNAGGTHMTGKHDVNYGDMSKEEMEATLKFRDCFYFIFPEFATTAPILAAWAPAHRVPHIREKRTVSFSLIKKDAAAGAIAFLAAPIRSPITTGKAARWRNASSATRELNRDCRLPASIPASEKFALSDLFSTIWIG